MKITAKTDYACRSLFELALHWPNPMPIQVNDIAERQGVPLNFLIHILLNLKQHGIVKSVRGKNGGYVLAKPPRDIKLSDIINHFSAESSAHLEHAGKGRNNQIMSLVWQEVSDAVSLIMKSVNFEDICNRARMSDKNFVYEI